MSETLIESYVTESVEKDRAKVVRLVKKGGWAPPFKAYKSALSGDIRVKGSAGGDVGLGVWEHLVFSSMKEASAFANLLNSVAP